MGSTLQEFGQEFGILAGGLVCGASFMVIALYVVGILS